MVLFSPLPWNPFPPHPMRAINMLRENVCTNCLTDLLNNQVCRFVVSLWDIVDTNAISTTIEFSFVRSSLCGLLASVPIVICGLDVMEVLLEVLQLLVFLLNFSA